MPVLLWFIRLSCPYWELTTAHLAQHEQLSDVLCWCQANESLFSLLHTLMYVPQDVQVVPQYFAAIVLISTQDIIKVSIADAVTASQRKKKAI